MMKNKFENLILLEFMINKIVFYENEYKIDKTFLCQLGETRVQIKFKGCCLLEITDDENTKTEVNARGHRIIGFESGKSCLLSMSQVMSSSNYDACFCISRKTPPSETMDRFMIGEAKVSLEPILKSLRKSSGCGPSTKSMKGEYEFKDRECNSAGIIDLFVRATDLGKNIVTMFQLGAGESSFYFKGTDGNQEEADEDEEDEDSTCFVCPESKFDARGPAEPYASPMPRRPMPQEMRPPVPQYPYYQEGMTFNQPMPQNMRTWPVMGPCKKQSFPEYQVPKGPAVFGGGPPGPSGGGMMPPVPISAGVGAMPPAAMQGMQGMQGIPQMPNQYQRQYRDEDYEKLDGDYKEISAEVNGYEVKIKLLRRPKKVVTE